MADATEAAVPAEAAEKPVLKAHHPLVVLNIVSISGSLFYCNLCPAGFKAQRSSGSSSNIYAHIAMKHREASAFLKRVKGANQHSFASGGRAVDGGAAQQSIVASFANVNASSATTAATLLVARTGLPPRVVLGDSFRNFVKSLSTVAKLPARKTLKRKLDELYLDVRARIARRLDDAICFSVACDGWSDPSRHALQGVVVLFSFTGQHIDARRQCMSPEVQQRDAVLRGNPMLVNEAAGVSPATASKKNTQKGVYCSK